VAFRLGQPGPSAQRRYQLRLSVVIVTSEGRDLAWKPVLSKQPSRKQSGGQAVLQLLHAAARGAIPGGSAHGRLGWPVRPR